ncbi:MAG: IS1595 family transposase [Candidatus Doudnabacteria bacterium]|nr:IS1595 family transposase [Candidatus Doudnabacteria bacterium]
MKYTIKDFNKVFKTDDDCLAYVFKYRFGTPECPKCENMAWYKVSGRKCWACGKCAYQIHPLAGTIFHKSDTSLKSWFFAIYKFANSRNGVSAKELERDLGCTYKTAWRIAKQIRKLFETGDFKLNGTVEVDDSYMEKTTRHISKTETPKAFAMVQRGGAVKAVVIRKAGMVNALPMIQSEVEKGSKIMTDSATLYMGNLPDYEHKAINHSKGHHAKGLVHTQSVDSFFAQVKRSISGTYHQVSEKYLQSYLDEFSWRLSNSRLGIPLFLLMLGRICQLQDVGGEKI